MSTEAVIGCGSWAPRTPQVRAPEPDRKGGTGLRLAGAGAERRRSGRGSLCSPVILKFFCSRKPENWSFTILRIMEDPKELLFIYIF